ncbi:MAG: glutamate--tRNA ligase [Archangiaceae bacterium]|nr:glutamate--tRNA ligase [Archangiaceae bacterium]
MKPRVRFAPSPTGYLHIGGARTALFNWLYARRNGGTFVLRIEDTDLERSTPESVKAILDGLKWLGIDWDEGPEVGGPFPPYFQTQRLASYKKHAEQLLAQGKAYRCYCTKEELDARRSEGGLGWKYDGKCRERKDTPNLPAVIRFKMPHGDGSYSFDDHVLGRITKTFSDLDDFVMMRADGIPLYNFGCVVDDHEMEITLVGRGQEHVNSTFPQLALYDALGWKPPTFAHFPLILGPDREKLSKRKHPEADVMLHKKNGILPEALLNFVIRLGWGHGDDEFIPVEQMKQWFGFENVGKTSGVWNPEKLVWLNQQYLKKLPIEDIAQRVTPFVPGVAAGDPRIAKLVGAFRERTKSLGEMGEKMAGYFKHGVTIDAEAAAKHLTPDGKGVLAKARDALTPLGTWNAAAIDEAVKKLAETSGLKMGAIAQPLRVAVTGTTTSPGIGETLELLGREEALSRIATALK